jgi:hypothetical protein
MIHLIHGFNVADGGKNTVDTLRPLLEKAGYEVSEFDYGRIGLLGVRFGNKKRARRLAGQVEPADIVVGHSNGCALIALAMQMGMTVSHAVFIHPALNRKWTPPKGAAEKVTVYFSEKDIATRAAKLLVGVMKLFPTKYQYMWGSMGTVGPKSDWPGWERVDDGMRHSEGFTVNPAMYCSNL